MHTEIFITIGNLLNQKHYKKLESLMSQSDTKEDLFFSMIEKFGFQKIEEMVATFYKGNMIVFRNLLEQYKKRKAQVIQTVGSKVILTHIENKESNSQKHLSPPTQFSPLGFPIKIYRQQILAASKSSLRS